LADAAVIQQVGHVRRTGSLERFVIKNDAESPDATADVVSSFGRADSLQTRPASGVLFAQYFRREVS
jgi:hypothetical protein